MSTAIDDLVRKIQELEEQAERELAGHRQRFHYTIKQQRIAFEDRVKARHRELRIGIGRFLSNSNVIGILVAPVIYALIVPLLLLDIAVTLFQALIFPIYAIPKVSRGDFIAIDRHHLAYLNPIERLNCAYCGYANGLLAFAREVAGRSEEHWCPIKHARRVRGLHRRYYAFAEYGDAEGYRQKNGKKPFPPS